MLIIESVKMRNKLDSLILWFYHRFGIEKKAIPSLQGLKPEEIKEGKMYEWWGRIVKAVKNPVKVEVTYIIHPDPNASQRAIQLMVEEIDKLEVKDDYYKTSDELLAEELKREGIFVEDEVKDEPCKDCCMSIEGLPCPECAFRYYWKLVAKYKQNCTDQEAWNRMMIKRIMK